MTNIKEDMMSRFNYRLNAEIENFIEQYDGTAIGRDVQNMYENGTSYETICDYLGWAYNDYDFG